MKSIPNYTSTTTLAVEQALAQMIAQCSPAAVMEVPLSSAHGHVVATEISSEIMLPPFDNSAVDGYAVHSAAIRGASDTAPVSIPLAFQQSAGPSTPVELEYGHAARIMTGAPTPGGADAVVMQEDTREGDAGCTLFLAAAEPGDHIRRAGADVVSGDIVLQSGTRIGPAELAILAAIGRRTVGVYSRPRVAIITTGDEVEDVEHAIELTFGKIYNSNRYCLTALVEQSGAEVVMVRHVPDDFDATCAALTEAAASGVHAIVCAGGVSVGARDFVKPALERLGRLDLWRVAMKPGKPVAFGSIDNVLFFGLPGNPASVMVTFELFVRPCLWKMAGRSQLARPEVEAILMDDIAHDRGRREYVRAHTRWHGRGYVSTTTGAQGSGRIKSLLGCNSFIVVSEDSGAVEAGETVHVMLTDQTL